MRGASPLRLNYAHRLVQAVLAVSLSLFFGGFLLLGVPAKLKLAFALVLAFVVLLLVAKNTRGVLLFTTSLVSSFYVGKDFVSSPNHIGELRSLGFYLIDALAIALILLYLGRLAIERRGQTSAFLSMTIPAAMWLAAALFSLRNARAIDVALMQMATMGKLFLLYLAVANSIQGEADARWLIGGLLLGLSCQALIGVAQGMAGHPLGLSFVGEGPYLVQQALGPISVHRAQGTIGHPNGYAMYLSATLSFAVAFPFSRSRAIYRVAAVGVLVVGVVGLVLSLSRGGWLSFVAVVVVVLVLAVRGQRLRLGVALGLGCLTLLAVLVLTLSQENLILTRFTSDDRGSAMSRVVLARGAAAMIRKYPLVGVGLNNYALFMPKYDPASLLAWQSPAMVHSVFLLVAAETGIVGLTGFVWFLTSLMVHAYRLSVRATSSMMWVAGVGSFCAFVSLAIHGMADYALIADVRLFAQFWLLAGLTAGLDAALKPGGGDAPLSMGGEELISK